MPPPGYPFPYFMPWGALPPMYGHMQPMQIHQGLEEPRSSAHQRLSVDGRYRPISTVNITIIKED
jgi:hypothetical protein